MTHLWLLDLLFFPGFFGSWCMVQAFTETELIPERKEHRFVSKR